MRDLSSPNGEKTRTVGREILRVVREWETDNSPVSEGDIVAAVVSEDVPRDVVLDHLERLERAGELYRANGGFRIP